MKLNYEEETDSFYIDLAAALSSDSKEIADGLVVDYEEAGRVVGIDILQASERIDLSAVETTQLPAATRIA